MVDAEIRKKEYPDIWNKLSNKRLELELSSIHLNDLVIANVLVFIA